MPHKNPVLEHAIKQAGSAAALGRLLGVTRAAICNAQRRGFLAEDKARIVADNYGLAYVDLVSPKLAKVIRAASY